MSHRPPYELDKKTKVALPISLLVSILIGVFTLGVFLAGIYLKLNRMVTVDQMNEWGYRLQQANRPWHNDFRVPPFPKSNEPVGQKKQILAESNP